MVNCPQFHSSSEKRFLGAVVPANTSGVQSLKVAMDTLFNHPNVGPFIGSQLIQRFVTSKPSAASVGRVAAAFNNNGAGVRGDMRTVISAMLLDTEARDNARQADPTWGKLREPMLRFGHWMRAFIARSVPDQPAAATRSGTWKTRCRASARTRCARPASSTGTGRAMRRQTTSGAAGRHPAPPGDIRRRGLAAPGSQITRETTVTGYANFVIGTVERGFGWNDTAILGNYTAELALAGNPDARLDRLNLLPVARAACRPAPGRRC